MACIRIDPQGCCGLLKPLIESDCAYESIKLEWKAQNDYLDPQRRWYEQWIALFPSVIVEWLLYTNIYIYKNLKRGLYQWWWDTMQLLRQFI